MVLLLTARVKRLDEDDLGKLKILLKYLKGTKYKKQTLRVDYFSVLNLWIDAYYNTHDYCRGHTGVIMRLVRGGFLSLSMKQNWNLKTSTEGGLIGAQYGLSAFSRRKKSIEAQEYTVYHDKLYQ